MERRAHDHVPALTAALSAVALALVFGAALQAIPATLLPPANETLFVLIPHVNAAISALAIVAILGGWRFVRGGQIRKHRASMLTAFGLFAVFLLLYLYRVAHVGPAEFPGPATIEMAYFGFLAVHIVLAIVCVPLLFYVLLLAWSRPVSAIYDTSHATIGRVAASLWLVSFTMGIVVYVLLHLAY